MANKPNKSLTAWNVEKDELILYCRDHLHMEFADIAMIFHREYPKDLKSRNAIIGRYSRMKKNGLEYIKKAGE